MSTPARWLFEAPAARVGFSLDATEPRPWDDTTPRHASSRSPGAAPRALPSTAAREASAEWEHAPLRRGPRRRRPAAPPPAARAAQGPSQVRLAFAAAVRNRDWRNAFLNLNGLSMFEMLRALEAMGATDSATLWSLRATYAPLINLPRVQYARDVVVRRELPPDVGDLRATGQVADAQAYLAERSVRDVAFDITGRFEGGRASLNTVDAGIVSYGKHQVTLAAGSLHRVLLRFTTLSSSDTAQALRGYLDRVAQRDRTLRQDATFLQLLRDAARERAMWRAQDDIATTDYWEPALRRATLDGVRSALGLAIYYDTIIQGGLAEVSERARRRLAGKPAIEAQLLEAFLDERRQRLLRVAAADRARGTPSAVKTAEMLEQSASPRGRVGLLQTLLAAGDLALRGDQFEQLSVAGSKVFGVRAAFRRVIQLLDPDPGFGHVPDYPEVFRILNGLNVAHMLVTLSALKRAGYARWLRDNFGQASRAGVFVARLDVLLQAVERRGAISPADFDRTVRVVLWPSMPAAERDDLLRFLTTTAPPHPRRRR